MRIRDVLKFLFPVPKEDSKRVMTFANEDDFISFRWALKVLPDNSRPDSPLDRHHVFVKIPGDIQLAEVGPRFQMKRMFSRSLVLCTQ